jgi:hypothetical protein
MMGNAYKILAGKLLKNSHMENQKEGGKELSSKMSLKKMDCGDKRHTELRSDSCSAETLIFTVLKPCNMLLRCKIFSVNNNNIYRHTEIFHLATLYLSLKLCNSE